jgi:DNA-binding MltR family transcriptional regulator
MGAIETRMNRANQMLEALKGNTDRGKACVGDAMLDEMFKELFRARFIDDQKAVEEALGGGQPLGNHGVRVKVAYLLSWIGPDTYHACRTIHRVRNAMAQSIEVNSFDDDTVRDHRQHKRSKVGLHHWQGGLQKINLKRRGDKFTITLVSAMLQVYQLIGESEHATPAEDLVLVPMTKSPP